MTLTLALFAGCAVPYVEKTIAEDPAKGSATRAGDGETSSAFFHNDFRYYLAHRIRGAAMGHPEAETRIEEVSSANAQTLRNLYGEEYQLIHAKRQAGKPNYPLEGPDVPPNLRALCLSGGGIRSASFNLGVLQALHELGALQEMDYLSSVSGGSYVASWYMTRHLMDDDDLFDPSGPQMRYLLSNGNYLSSGHAGNTKMDLYWRMAKHFSTVPFHWLWNGVFSMDTNVGVIGNRSFREAYRISLADTFLSDYAEAFVSDYGEVLGRMHRQAENAEGGAGIGGGDEKEVRKGKRFLADIIDWKLPKQPGRAIPSVVDLLSFALEDQDSLAESDQIKALIEQIENSSETDQTAHLRKVLQDLAGAATLSNMAGYRDRPGTIQRRAGGNAKIQGPPTAWNLQDLLIEESGLIENPATEDNPFAFRSSVRPFWIANAGLGLKDDRTLFKNQFGDNFEMTPLYCGADAIGYVRTDDRHRWMGLSYILQMSGAAISESNVNLPEFAGFLISTLNFDLGRFIDSWSYGKQLSYPRLRRVATAFYPFHRMLEFLGFDLGHRRTVKARKHFISDGGFFETLGALSVIRRGARTLVISDCTGDPNYLEGEDNDRARAFFNLKRLGLRLRNELGASLVMPLEGEDDYGPIIMGEIRNLPVDGSGSDTVKVIVIKPTYELSDAHKYPRFIQDYKASEEGKHFPQQSTSDQYFGEVQLTAYRELGYQTVIQNAEVFESLLRDSAN